MTPAEAIVQFGAVHKAINRSNPASVVHVTETCKQLDGRTETRELVHPGELPLSARLCSVCAPAEHQQAAADGGQR